MPAILFDFDGTLADSEVQMLAVIDTLAERFGYAHVAPEEVEGLRKLSAWQFVTKRLGIAPWRLLTLRRFEREAKSEFEMHADDIELVAGVTDVVVRLRSLHYTVGVVSSSPAGLVTHVLAKDECEVDFIEAGSAAFSKAHAIRRTLRRHHLDAKRTCYVGDELRDVEASKSAGVKMVGVSWGLNGADALRGAGAKVASTPEELFSMLTTHV